MYVFGYGSLLNVESLRATLPDVRLADCRPATLAGYLRTFDVAFPNDGSQSDKAYFAADGRWPAVVLFANLRRHDSQASVNGIAIPVTPEQVELLARRERRYAAVDVGRGMRAFVGRPEFTDPERVAAGVFAEDYLATIDRGVTYWERRRPGFRADFETSTQTPAANRVLPLQRVNQPGMGP